jgi:Zn ribbon nucleic-acid-binding protein
MTETTKLKPCPFCGGEVNNYEIDSHQHTLALWMPDYNGSHVIECVKCDFHMIDYSKQIVFEKWNTRAEGWQAIDDFPKEDFTTYVLRYHKASGRLTFVKRDVDMVGDYWIDGGCLYPEDAFHPFFIASLRLPEPAR